MIYWADMPDGTIDIYLLFVPLTGHYLIGHCQKWQGNEAELGASKPVRSITRRWACSSILLICLLSFLSSHIFGLSGLTSVVLFLTPDQQPTQLMFSLCASVKRQIKKLLEPLEQSILSMCRPLSWAGDLFRYERGANRAAITPAGNGLG